ncbi:hypothetical protein BDY17DRAFT_291602 [Neohortaea acidophila]|uniref:Uncharacterized protein n=1 Tax=Neohortaea acidophila TaxID=245834 RepID=A0A6A6Q1X7_9PEZI|nr:uncharacterized protein BDY17DRAFT_291602 [Neohortaea acidophila]KAF2486498.1 hypothetical protein BDY17DRAFT_291602 [Neohortaea acidophila]
MAALATPSRLSARLAQRCAPRAPARRGFRVCARNRAAQNYTMPALSPTMSEGNIASWKVKEGASFSAGDVILEIETDKATMDVEAQDDGILFKIIAAEGAKGVPVGQRIAVFADVGDDLESLEVPAEEKSASKSQEQRKEESQPKQKEEEEDSKQTSEKGSSGGKSADATPTASPAKEETTSKQGGNTARQKYPLLPSVEHLLHANGYSTSEVDKIPTSGPNGRLLKGDVLAYLGRINKEYPEKQSKRIEKLSHLDLSNIRISKKEATKPAQADKAKSAAAELPQETEIALPITLSAVIATQKRVQDSLGIFLPLSTFIARASELANEDLPPSRNRKPTADELFNSVLGLDQIHHSSRGSFIPQIMGISNPPLVASRALAKKPDIIDFLAPKAAKRKVSPVTAAPAAVGVSPSGNIFSVTARVGEEARAAEYLERMKVALEQEPGRLVL